METALSSKIIHWAHGHLGQQVGSGECWDLVDRALRHAGARTSTTTGKNDDYVWGTPITLEQVVPGDILQFRDFVVTTRIERTVRFPDGTGYRDDDLTFARRPHHSAIVHHVNGGGVFRVYEQRVSHWGTEFKTTPFRRGVRLLSRQ